MNVLVLDIGGTNVKVMSTEHPVAVKVKSGPRMTPAEMVQGVREVTAEWAFDVISIGFPAAVRDGRILHEPHHLGAGWVGFDFEAAFGKPVRLVNDALMQALGSYSGGRMLFLSLGTGLGSALIDHGHAIGLELAHLPYRNSTYEGHVSEAARKRVGRRRWEQRVHVIAELLCKALVCDTIVFGGGNARLLEQLPAHGRLGGNALALPGGVMLWEAPRVARP